MFSRKTCPCASSRHHAMQRPSSCHTRTRVSIALPVLIRPVFSLDVEFTHFTIPDGDEAALPAHVCLVDADCKTVLKTYIRPRIVPGASFAGGVRPHSYANAPELQDAQQDIIRIIAGSTVVGLGVRNDLRKLGIEHPDNWICDLMEHGKFQGRGGASKSLTELARVHLKRKIQPAGRLHDPEEDAVAAMELYLKYIAVEPPTAYDDMVQFYKLKLMQDMQRQQQAQQHQDEEA